MTEYARIVDGAVAEVRHFDIPPDPNPVKGLDWRPFTRVRPAFDNLTQVREPTRTTVTKDGVEEAWPVRDKTAEELTAEQVKRDQLKAEVFAERLAQEPLLSLVKRIEALEAANAARVR